MEKENPKVPFNLSLDEELKRAVKVYCAATDEKASDVTERLWREFLEEEETKRKKARAGSRYAGNAGA